MGLTILDLVDIAIVAYLIYKLINLIQGTRAATLLKGLAVLVVAGFLARSLALQTLSWILDQSATVVLVALPIVFYPELRRALEQIGRGQFFHYFGKPAQETLETSVAQTIEAVQRLSQRRIGALIAIEQETGLQEYIESGVSLDALVSSELLLNIFQPQTPLHDGAVIIRYGRIAAAGCLLPLTENPLSSELGTRHRAALGMSEQTDSLVVVASEETGAVSAAISGRLHRNLNKNALRELLLRSATDTRRSPFEGRES